MSGGGAPPAIPGVGQGVATTGGGGLAAHGGAGGSHDQDSHFAQQIAKALRMSGDPIYQAQRMVNATLEACWVHIDNMAKEGIQGSVIRRWSELLLNLGYVHMLLKQAEEHYDGCMEDVRGAKARQAAVGNPVQDAVMVEPEAVASSTRYYGKR